MRHTGFRDIICIRKNQNPVKKENDADMKKVLAMVLAFCLLCGSTSALAVTYTMPEKLSRQLVIGSGLKGSFVLNAEGSSGAAAVLSVLNGAEIQVRGMASDEDWHYYFYQTDENENQWDQALKACELFVQQPDATTIQIPGEPDAYKNARHLIDFNNSSKDWTFETLQELEKAVKKAIDNRDWRALDRYKAKVNFFSMSWRQDETDPNSQEEFSMGNWMIRKAHYAETLDESSNSNEAYLKTWGWNTYVSTWYLYFRKVNFPLDPDINGNWEWAGIYIGNKL